jgi:hypothetical protein
MVGGMGATWEGMADMVVGPKGEDTGEVGEARTEEITVVEGVAGVGLERTTPLLRTRPSEFASPTRFSCLACSKAAC